jgi:protease-4
MRKFILGVVCGLAFAFLAGVILIFTAVRLGGDKAPTIDNDSVLMLRLEGEIPEKPAMELPLPFFEEPRSVTMVELWSALNRAAEDTRIKAVVLEPKMLFTGWASIEQIRQDLLKFKKSGKPIYCRLQTPGTKEYYLATAADKIFLAPDDRVDMKGLRIESTYWKNTLDKVGVQIEIEHAGKYKDFGDTYSRTSMTPETREVLNGFLDQFYGDLIRVIAEGRKKKPEDVRTMLDDGPFLARKSKEFGLVDVTGYEDDMYTALKDQLKLKEVKKAPLKDYARSRPQTKTTPKGRIAFLVADGGISGSANMDPEEEITAPSMVRMMKQIEKDDSINGVIFRVNSPGGDALASDLILHQAKLLSKKKPMIISMADYAASGGYMISMTGDTVLSYPNTITGSIGVVFGKANLRGLYDKLGIQKEILTRGKNAAIDSEYLPMDENARAKLREGILETYNNFLESVAEGRRKKKEEIAPIAEGRAWTGSQAKTQALVDELGGLDRAIELIKAKAKIDPKEKVALVPYPERKTLFEVLTSKNAPPDSTSIADEAVLRRFLKTAFPDPSTRTWVRTVVQGGMMRMAPKWFEVR